MQISKELHSRLESKRSLLGAEDLKKEEETATRDLLYKYGDRIGKVMSLL